MITYCLKTVQKYDIIHLIDQEKIVDQCTYNELVKNNSQFKEMVEHA